MSSINLVLCHGRSDRCLSVRGYEFPICARCTAIYFGFLAGLVLEMFFGLPSAEFILIYIILVLPTAIDGSIQLIFERESTNLLRLVTGFPAGVGSILFIRTLSRMLM